MSLQTSLNWASSGGWVSALGQMSPAEREMTHQAWDTSTPYLGDLPPSRIWSSRQRELAGGGAEQIKDERMESADSGGQNPVRLAIVGSGWRAQLFARLAATLPAELSLVGGCVRRAESVQPTAAAWQTPVYTSVTELVSKQRPQLVVVCVPWEASAAMIVELVGLGVRVLAETPPAPDLDGLRQLWDRVGAADSVQAAEQYLMMPGHAARAELLRRSVIGEPSSVQVSSTHTYHAISMMRGLLGVGFGEATVSARVFSAPLVDPLDRDGWTEDDRPKPAATTLATIDFGDGRNGLYDFTDNQWHNQLRLRRIVIRGSHGEIADDQVVRLAGPRLILRSALVRSQLGYDLNLDGYDTEHLSFDGQVVYRNPFLGLRLMDEEIAMCSVLVQSARWAVDQAAGPYDLAQACQDHLIGLAIDEAATTGQPVSTSRQPWAGVS